MALVGCLSIVWVQVGGKSWKEGEYRDWSALWLSVVAIVCWRWGVGFVELLVEIGGSHHMLGLLDVVVGIR